MLTLILLILFFCNPILTCGIFLTVLNSILEIFFEKKVVRYTLLILITIFIVYKIETFSIVDLAGDIAWDMFLFYLPFL